MAMAVLRQNTPNAQQSRICVKTVLEDMGEGAREAVLLVPSFAAVQGYRKAFADLPFGFGITVTTFSAWIADRWGLYGDGRAIVTSDQRNLLMHKALSLTSAEGKADSLEVSPGTVKMLAAMAEEAYPYLVKTHSFDSLNLSVAEVQMCEVMHIYGELLAARSLCENAEALIMLTDIAWPVPPILFEGFGSFNVSEDYFINKIGEAAKIFVFSDGRVSPVEEKDRAKELIELQSCIFNPVQGNPIIPRGSVSFLLPSGAYAAPRLLGNSLSEYVAEGNKAFAVSSTDPAALFTTLSPYLFNEGIAVSVTAQKSYAENDFGKTWITLLTFFLGDGYSVFQMSDILLSPFSGLSSQKAYELDALWRSDRTTSRQRCIEDASKASTFLASIFMALDRGAYAEALGLFEKRVMMQGLWDKAYRSEQLLAISKTEAFFDALAGSEVSALEALPLLEQSSVTYRAELKTGEHKAPYVDIMSLDALSQQAACSYDCVVLCDLDSSHYPMREVENAKSRIFEKLGIPTDEDTLEGVRQDFFRVLSVPRKRLVCERTLNGVDAQETYPAVMLEELLDCYRGDLLSPKELERSTGLPKVLLPFVATQGEGMLYKDAVVSNAPQDEEGQEALPTRGIIDDRSKDMIMISHNTKEIGQKKGFSLSPSAVESYLECPYKWFSLRRLRLAELDAGFGALEMGNFAHFVLKRFYQCFQQQGEKKVTSENLENARILLSEVFDQHLEMQLSMKPGDRPLIPLTALERAEVASFKKKLIHYLDFEVDFLPTFTPRYFEYDFGKNLSLDYAGNTLHGTIDRVDVNEKGQAVVIDYKGSVSSEYAYGESSEISWAPRCDTEKALILPHKVQTLLYAQALRRELDLEVVGALYISYGHKNVVSGAYDQRILGPANIPGIQPDLCAACSESARSFASVLDQAEESISCVLSRLSEGFIEPHPRGKDPCGFCPVTACEARR